MKRVNSMTASPKLNEAAAGLPGRRTLYSWMMPFWCSSGGGSQEMLMEVLFWFPTVRTVTCWGGALGAARGKNKTKQVNESSALYCALQE